MQTELTPPPTPEQLSVGTNRACQILGIGRTLLWSKTADGTIPHFRIGSRVLYRVEALRDWMRTQERRGARR